MFVDNNGPSAFGGDGHRLTAKTSSPRLGKSSDRSLSFGIVKDVLIAATYERGEDRNRKIRSAPLSTSPFQASIASP